MERSLKILMVYPRYPDTFWSLKQALRVISKKAAFPPLGLLTVASLLPKEWEKKLVDMNVTNLKDSDLKWADYVFISAMVVQWDSVKEVVRRCKSLNVKMVAGGPLFTNKPHKFEEIDHLVLDEAEITLMPFLADLAKGTLKHIYTSTERPDLSAAPIPMWSLINMKKYATLNAQYSRGCPFDCDFCNIGQLYGHNVRTKSKEHSVAELDAIYNAGWRGRVFIVDDNFVGNKKKLKAEVLPAMIEWQKQHN